MWPCGQSTLCFTRWKGSLFGGMRIYSHFYIPVAGAPDGANCEAGDFYANLAFSFLDNTQRSITIYKSQGKPSFIVFTRALAEYNSWKAGGRNTIFTAPIAASRRQGVKSDGFYWTWNWLLQKGINMKSFWWQFDAAVFDTDIFYILLHSSKSSEI